MGSLRRGATRTALIALTVLAASVAALWLGGPARAQSPAANFAYVVYPAGWNLVSFGDLTSLEVTGGAASPIAGQLYTFQPNDRDYERTDLSSVKPGNGYWVFFNYTFSVLLDTSSLTSWHVTVPGGQCAMVANPSTLGSARVTGADRVYTFSAVLNNYIQESLIGIGRGAWACNDSAAAENVTIAYGSDITNVTWPNCCSPQHVNNGGQSVIVFHNDSPAPLIVGVRQIDANGDPAPITDNNFFRDALDSCASCPEYNTHPSCSPSATTLSANLAPGDYTLHVQSEDRNVGDIQVNVTLDPDTSYDVCFFVDANRPQKNLP